MCVHEDNHRSICQVPPTVCDKDSVVPELTKQARLAGHQAVGICMSLPPQPWDNTRTHYHSGGFAFLKCGLCELNSSPPVCTVDTLQVELPH